MTTTVKVIACCEPSEREVKISFENGHGPQEKIIQDREEFECVVHGDISCTVQEIEKKK